MIRKENKPEEMRMSKEKKNGEVYIEFLLPPNMPMSCHGCTSDKSKLATWQTFD
jgi:hypothetical protein